MRMIVRIDPWPVNTPGRISDPCFFGANIAVDRKICRKNPRKKRPVTPFTNAYTPETAINLVWWEYSSCHRPMTGQFI
jgi:hypothetical protein